MPEKTFTLEEAEQLLSQIEPMVKNMMEYRRNAIEIGQQLMRAQEQLRAGEASTVKASDLMNMQTELDFFVKIIGEGLDAIEEMGAQPKDLDMGLVDFPSIVDGKQVLLCWKYGEDSIGFYHDPAEGYAGRKPLPELKKRA
ncbi:MAG TPA: DUF2203 domain-containing protein [Acidobacteriota bacterium]